MMADELKPCRFCGAPGGISVYSGIAINGFQIECCGDDLDGDHSTAIYRTEPEAIAAWNTRPAPKADSALVGDDGKLTQAPPDERTPEEIERAVKEATARLIEYETAANAPAALSDRDVVLEEAAKKADDVERRSNTFGLHEKASGAGAAATAIRALKGGVDE